MLSGQDCMGASLVSYRHSFRVLFIFLIFYIFVCFTHDLSGTVVLVLFVLCKMCGPMLVAFLLLFK